MNGHKKYKKVYRIEKDECQGILDGRVFVFEKLDGANASVWLDSEGRLCVGSRNLLVSCGDEVFDTFRGLVEYARANEPINALLVEHPSWRLYGEWLVKHTINYAPEHQNKLYIFDVYDHDKGRYLTYDEYSPTLEAYRVPFVQSLGCIDNPTKEQLETMLGHSDYGADPAGEGIVIKNYSFINKFGNIAYGKMVTRGFQEVHAVTGANTPKDDIESRIAAQYVSEARVRKIITKHNLHEMSDIPKLFGCVYNDVVTEDMWDILKRYKNPTIDFKKLNKHIQAAAKSYYISILQEVV